MAISIGGDGTFLNTARWIGSRQIPILGINTGHLGYLAACSMEDAIGYVPAIVKGDYIVEDRAMLWVRSQNHVIDWPYALNEVAILKKDTSSMLNVKTTINGQPLAVYRADGLIVSTPTGSTGYNLSVGGPILQPSTPALVIVPIAPHSLTMRPVVIDDRSTITTTTDTRADSYLLSLDGRSTPLPVDSSLTIHRAPFVTKVVHLTRDYTFVDTLHTKLHCIPDKYSIIRPHMPSSITNTSMITSHPLLGEVKVKVHPATRKVTYRWTGGMPQMTIPRGLTWTQVNNLIDRIAPRLAMMRPQAAFYDGKVIETPFLTLRYGASDTVAVSRLMGRIDRPTADGRPSATICFNHHEDTSSSGFQSSVSRYSAKVAQRIAGDSLIAYARSVADSVDLHPRSWSIGTGTRTLGTCSSLGNITLSRCLLFFPTELVEYVIKHELAHLIHHDHSPDSIAKSTGCAEAAKPNYKNVCGPTAGLY